MTIRAQVMSGIRWTVSARLLAQLVTWSLTLIVIRILSPGDYGLLAMASMFIAFATMFGDIGLGSAVVQSNDVTKQVLRQVFGAVLVVHALLSAILIAVAPLVVLFFAEPRVGPVLSVLALQFLISAFAVVPDALLQRELKFKGRSLIDLVSVLAGSAMTLVLALAGNGVWALVFGTLLTSALKTIGVNSLVRSFVRPSFAWRGIAPMLRFGGHLTASQVLWIAFSQSDVLICGRLLGKESLGIYSVAMHVASLPIQRIAGIINQVAFPTFARLQHDLPRIGDNVLRGVRFLSLFAFPVLWGISSVAPEIVEVILGSRWAAATLPLQILALVMPMRMIGNFLPNAVQGIGRSDLLLVNAVWAIALAPPLFFLAATHWGLLGLSFAWLIVLPVLFLQSVHRTLPVLGLRISELWQAMLPPAIAGTAMYTSVIVIRALLPPENPGVVRLVTLVAGGAIAYLAGSWIVNRRGIDEARELFRGVLSGGAA